MSAPANSSPTNPERVRAFARFFKNYMSISSIVTASLPIPVTAIGLIPTYKEQTKILSVYTPLFCFLTLGFIFFSRHHLARVMFPEYLERTVIGRGFPAAVFSAFSGYRRAFFNALPLIFIAASVYCVIQYHRILALSAAEVGARPAVVLYGFNDVLLKTQPDAIPFATQLMFYYVAIFVTAEAAFILMAIKEYLQDLMGYSERDLILGPQRRTISKKATQSNGT